MSERLTKGTLISVDTETTGVDPTEARIVQLGVVVFEAGACTTARSHLFHPGVPIPGGASAVHGIYDEHVVRRPRLSAYPKLRALMESTRLIGYNLIDYDGEVLRAECARHLRAVLPAPGGIDALVFARWHLRHLRDRRLTTLCRHFGIELTAAHSAAADARAAGEVLLRLIERGLLPDDRAAALAAQGRIRDDLIEERRRWGNCLYTDRDDRRTLRVGYSKYCGLTLEQVPADFFRWALGNQQLPPEVIEIYRRRLPVGTPVHQAQPLPLFSGHAGSGRAGLHTGSN